MTRYRTFGGLEELSRDAINRVPSHDAEKLLIETLNLKGWCVVGNAASNLEEFREFVSRLRIPIAEKYGDLPHSGASEIFQTTPYPPQEDLLFHHEASHTPRVPRYLFFYCHQAAESGGFTPISDGARALELIDHTISDALRRHGLIYRRRFVDGLDVPWQKYFDTDDPDEVERYCLDCGLASSWVDDGVLQVDYSTLAIGHLPGGRQTMFHQIALHHPTFLADEIREYFRLFDPDGCTPRDVFLGDGTPLPDKWAQEIVDAQNRAGKYFAWEKGDILAIDNRIYAHGRTRFTGMRENYVIMSDLEAVKDVWSAS